MTDDLQELGRLFDVARERGGIEFIFAMTRVEGMSFDRPDPLGSTDDAKADPATAKLSSDARSELLKLLDNLLRCGEGRKYCGYVDVPEKDHVRRLSETARESGYTDVAKTLDAGGTNLCRLLTGLRSKYIEERRAVLGAKRFYKLAGFEVLELLVNDDGLCGFRIHFSNDELAEFRRSPSSTEPLNLAFDDEGSVVLYAGDLSALRDEWRVAGKPLYETGLPGRYNPIGEWKPLVYPGIWDEFSRQAKEASARPEVQGALLYCYLTGHHAFEFAVKTSVELPHDSTSFGEARLELVKVPPPPGGEVVYDGTVALAGPDARAVEDAITLVQALMNQIAFAFDAAVTWAPKYSTVYSGGTRATPSEEDLHVLDRLLVASNRDVLDQAIDWYNRGNSSPNVFVAFLCAYIALESTATAVWEGDIEVKVPFIRPSKPERKADALRRVEELRSLQQVDSPLAFIQHAYFECVVGLTRRVKEVATAVFGAESHAVARLFSMDGGSSLANLRSLLAHGDLSLADPSARDLVRNRLPEIRDVTREFLMRVALDLLPPDEVPQWSGLHHFGITMDDPRATLCTSSLDQLPQSDWRIRAAWIE